MKDTDSTLAQFDQAGAERLEKIYLTPDVVQQREQIFQLLDVKQGMNALDIGCGPGLTSLSLAQAVGRSPTTSMFTLLLEVAPQLRMPTVPSESYTAHHRGESAGCPLLMPQLALVATTKAPFSPLVSL